MGGVLALRDAHTSSRPVKKNREEAYMRFLQIPFEKFAKYYKIHGILPWGCQQLFAWTFDEPYLELLATRCR